jgi:hypothetical protein
LHVVFVGDGRPVGDEVCVAVGAGLSEVGGTEVLVGAADAEEDRPGLPGVDVGEPEAVPDADGETADGLPLFGVPPGSVVVSSGEASPVEEASRSPLVDGDGAEPSPERPESVTTENIATAPTTATAPTPYAAARCRRCLARRAAPRLPSSIRAARPPPSGSGSSSYASSYAPSSPSSPSAVSGSRAVSLAGGSPSRSTGVPHPGHE